MSPTKLVLASNHCAAPRVTRAGQRLSHVILKAVVVITTETQRKATLSPRAHAFLEPVANRPIAHHVLDSLSAAGIDDLVIAAPADLSPQVREAIGEWPAREGTRLRYVESRPPLDFGGALAAAAPLIGMSPCVVHVGNGLLGEPLTTLVDRLDEGAADLHFLVQQGAVQAELLSRETKKLLRVTELDRKNAALAMAGVCLFGPGGLMAASSAGWGAQGDIDLTGVADQLAAVGGNLDFQLIENWRSYRGDAADLLELNRIALDRIQPSRPPPNSAVRIEGPVFIHESACVRDSVIVGPAMIGPDATIVESYIGPYTSVGEGARIEGAEIERSIISAGASIMHIGARLVSSVIGRDTKVFRDFSLPRALRLRVGEGTEVALC